MTAMILQEHNHQRCLIHQGEPSACSPSQAAARSRALPAPAHSERRCLASEDVCRFTRLNTSAQGAHKCHLIRGSVLYQRVIKFLFMRIKWAFAAVCYIAARAKLEMKSKWKRFNQIICLQKISSTANVFLMWYCATEGEEMEIS